jgi:hypothetical protein
MHRTGIARIGLCSFCVCSSITCSLIRVSKIEIKIHCTKQSKDYGEILEYNYTYSREALVDSFDGRSSHSLKNSSVEVKKQHLATCS